MKGKEGEIKSEKERYVCGVLVPSEATGEDEHTHDMYLISWDGRQVHVHNFKGVTSFDVGHSHRYVGTTAPAPSGVQHTHAYQTRTSFDDGHSHIIRGITGPAVPLPNGVHYHFFEGVTTVDGATPHTHRFHGRTSNAI